LMFTQVSTQCPFTCATSILGERKWDLICHSNVVGFVPCMHGQFHSNHLSHGWHWCEGSMWPFQHSFSQGVPQPYFLWTRVSSFLLCACNVLQLLSWVSTLTNQFVDLKALLFPKKTNVSMPHGKTQLMLVCIGLNVALVEAPPSTNLQHIVCIFKLSCRYCIFPQYIVCIFKNSCRYCI
jgi:hypothetical protein